MWAKCRLLLKPSIRLQKRTALSPHPTIGSAEVGDFWQPKACLQAVATMFMFFCLVPIMARSAKISKKPEAHATKNRDENSQEIGSHFHNEPSKNFWQNRP
jgi:hypothetical protein